MPRRLLSILAVLLLTTRMHAAPQSPAAPATASSSLDEKLSAFVTRGDVPGLVVMAATRDRVVYQGVFGKAEVGRHTPMTADALFRIASMTKAVTSAAALQLYEQGRFALDDPAGKYLPELAKLQVFESFDHATGRYTTRPATGPVTIRHLFTHTSGLGCGFTSRFERMILNGGTLGGARILAADTIALMLRNHIGDVTVRTLKTAEPDVSMDFRFVDDGKDKWSLGLLLTTRHVPGKGSAGSLSRGGLNNTYFWIDPVRDIAGIVMMQLLPFADTKAPAVYDVFERGVYRVADDTHARE